MAIPSEAQKQERVETIPNGSTTTIGTWLEVPRYHIDRRDSPFPMETQGVKRVTQFLVQMINT